MIGGGPAGLQAALTLGRMHRRTLLLDSGEYRNAPAEHMHNFVTHDGTPPAEFRAAARAELAAYTTVTVRGTAASAVGRDGDEFRVELGPDARADGGELDPAIRAQLDDAGVAVRLQAVKELMPSAAGATVSFADGPDEEVGGVFVAAELGQRAPFAEQLGLGLLPSGAVEVDATGRTSVPGVFAAGDMAHTSATPMPLASVLTAAASGLVAAASLDGHLLAADHPS
ncbi:FAD-dependent oxidoreductase [Promicromonospora panici]|uniref:FAD-dependent oxidoreductase n=1 Tax=Promicromonospora panici TaxID=2219658 RepID=UPI001F5E1670|nr:FAD-dependent oxidoreductase [Promicromonospora panici]